MNQDILKKTTSGELGRRIEEANRAALDMLVQADPVWEDVKPAGEVLEGLDDYMVTHSGPPIDNSAVRVCK